MECSEIMLGSAIDNNVYDLIAWDYPGIIGIESATAYWGLSTYTTSRCIILFNNDDLDASGFFVNSSMPMFFAPDINEENVVYLSKSLRVTDREQTVCDMVRYERHEYHLFETLINAYDGDVDVKRMERLAKQYNILDKMRELYHEALLIDEYEEG